MKNVYVSVFCALIAGTASLPLVAGAWNQDTVRVMNESSRTVEAELRTDNARLAVHVCVAARQSWQKTVSATIHEVRIGVLPQVCDGRAIVQRTFEFKQPAEKVPESHSYTVKESSGGNFEFLER